MLAHDNVIKQKYFPRNWPFVPGEAGDLRRHRAHYDVIVMDTLITKRKMYTLTRKIPIYRRIVTQQNGQHIGLDTLGLFY